MVPAQIKNNRVASPGYTTGATILVSRRELDTIKYAAMAKVSRKKHPVMWEFFSSGSNVSQMFESCDLKAYCIDVDYNWARRSKGIRGDVRTFDLRKWPSRDFVWASPPCVGLNHAQEKIVTESSEMHKMIALSK